jgi:hypothetical protein
MTKPTEPGGVLEAGRADQDLSTSQFVPASTAPWFIRQPTVMVPPWPKSSVGIEGRPRRQSSPAT